MGSNPTRPTKVSKKGFRIPEPFLFLGRPSSGVALQVRFRASAISTDPAAPPNQPLEESDGEPRPLPDTPPDTDPLAPGSSPEDEEALERAPRKP
ncbi:hypothetical protein [Paraburkholderia youngii]|uniref:hypothetical protein n=1 Tax=Paraburkholderia youngii TaxID=2782701 RepID=UPI003D2364D1